MSSRVEEEIKRANQSGDEIENLVVAKGQCPTGDRNTLLMAYWSPYLQCENEEIGDEKCKGQKG